MRPAALLAVNHGAHVRGLHTHNPHSHLCIHLQLQSCSTRPLCQLIHTKTSIFHSHTHTHTLTHTQCSTPGSRRTELGSVPRSPRSKSSQTSSRRRAGWWAERTRGLPSCTDTLSLEKGRSSQYRAAPGQKGIGSLWLTNKPLWVEGLLSPETFHMWHFI